jgi:serine/threonine-protein kinase
MPAIAISPDGKQIAVVLRAGDKQQLYFRSVETGESKPIAGTEGAVTPFFSPDGKWLGFFSGGKIRKLALDSGQIVTLCDAGTGPRGAVWSSDNIIIYTPDTGSALLQVPAAGGTPKPLTERKEERSDRWPELLPGNKVVLFTIAKGGSWDDAQIVSQNIATGERKVIIDGGTAPTYLPSGHLLYLHGGALTAVAFNAQTLQVSGKPVPLVQGIMMEARDGASQYSISRNGTLVYVPTNISSADRRMVWVSPDGSVAEALKAPPKAYEHPRLSPDGKRIVVGITGDNPNVSVYDIAANSLKQVTTEYNNAIPIWAPDGKRVVYRSTKPGPWNIFWKNADGSGTAEQLTNTPFVTEPASWSRDGKLLAFSEQNTVSKRDIFVLQMDGRKLVPVIQTPADESVARFSPDAHWLAYVSDESGRAEVWVQPYPTNGQKWKISTAGGREPVWSPTASVLYYREGTKMMVVDFKTTPSFSAAQPRLLFDGKDAKYETALASRPNFDITSDGKRFLMLQAVDNGQSSTQMKVVSNWVDELKRRVPAK